MKGGEIVDGTYTVTRDVRYYAGSAWSGGQFRETIIIDGARVRGVLDLGVGTQSVNVFYNYKTSGNAVNIMDACGSCCTNWATYTATPSTLTFSGPNGEVVFTFTRQ